MPFRTPYGVRRDVPTTLSKLAKASWYAKTAAIRSRSAPGRQTVSTASCMCRSTCTVSVATSAQAATQGGAAHAQAFGDGFGAQPRQVTIEQDLQYTIGGAIARRRRESSGLRAGM